MPGKRKPGGPKRRKGEGRQAWQKKGKRKFCIFCKDKVDYVDYKDVITLRKFVSERGKLRARRVTGNCVQHQRDVATAVKNAREMALLPYWRDEGHPPEARRQARRARRHRRGCRRLRAQLPDPSGYGGQGREGHGQPCRQPASCPREAPLRKHEGRVRGQGIEADRRAAPSASRPRLARKASCSGPSPPSTSPRRSRPSPTSTSTGVTCSSTSPSARSAPTR